MTANTSPDNLTYPVGTDPFVPLNAYVEDLAKDVQAALTSRFRGGGKAQTQNFATPAARDAAIPSPSTGDTVYVPSLQQLQSYSGGAWTPIAGRMPGFRSFLSNSQVTVATSTDLVLLGGFATSYYGGFAPHASGVYTVPYSGMYRIFGQFEWINNATGARRFLVSKNGVAASATPSAGMVIFSEKNAGTTSAWEAHTIYQEVPLVAGDQIRFQIWQNSGATIGTPVGTAGSFSQTFFGMTYQGN